VVEDHVRAREGLRIADAARHARLAACGRRVLGGVCSVGSVGARPWHEVPAGACVLLNCGAAGGEDKLASEHGHDAADHVDGRDAAGVVVARLADDAEGLGAKAGLSAVAAPLAEEADVLGAADAGLALAALGYEVQCFFLRPPYVAREWRGADQGVYGRCVAEGRVAQEGGVFLAYEALVVAVALILGDERGVEGGCEDVTRGEPPALGGKGRRAPWLGREGARGAVDAGQALVGVLGGD